MGNTFGISRRLPRRHICLDQMSRNDAAKPSLACNRSPDGFGVVIMPPGWRSCEGPFELDRRPVVESGVSSDWVVTCEDDTWLVTLPDTPENQGIPISASASLGHFLAEGGLPMGVYD